MEKYSLSMRIVHWLMAALILTLIGVGLWMSDLPNEDPRKFQVYGLHKSFGVVALFFIIFRLSIRLRSSIPALPKQINAFDSKLSSITVLLLYICMFVMPLSGYMMSTFAGYPVHLFSLELPSLFNKNEVAAGFNHSLHVYTGYFLAFIIGLHVIGSLKHLVVEKVNLFKRMW